MLSSRPDMMGTQPRQWRWGKRIRERDVWEVGWAACVTGSEVSLMTPKFLSRGILTEETSPDWLLSQPITGDPHHPPSQESKARWG